MRISPFRFLFIVHSTFELSYQKWDRVTYSDGDGDGNNNYRMRWIAAVTLMLFLVVRGEITAVNPICAFCHEVVGEYQRVIPRKPTELALDAIGT